ncbi:MAG: hypothetical protein L0H94_11170 [Nitrospira sp.]|nr:hypothetical protein [Nitrospira sp.]
MNDQEKKQICELMGQVVDTFVKEWACKPLHWLQEIDIQCDLFSRLSKVLTACKKCDLEARHSDYPNQHEFSRITCEPYVLLSEKSYAHPDIVVWDDANNTTDNLKSGRWPILWVCEIKYKTSTSDASDLDKLRQMLENKTALSACWIKLILHQKTSIPEQEKLSDPRIRIIEKHVRLE